MSYCFQFDYLCVYFCTSSLGNSLHEYNIGHFYVYYPHAGFFNVGNNLWPLLHGILPTKAVHMRY